MNLYIIFVLSLLAFNLASRVRKGEPWILRFAWLFTISIIAYGISNGTNSTFHQWLIGALQGSFISIAVCEMRLRWLRKSSSSSK